MINKIFFSLFSSLILILSTQSIVFSNESSLEYNSQLEYHIDFYREFDELTEGEFYLYDRSRINVDFSVAPVAVVSPNVFIPVSIGDTITIDLYTSPRSNSSQVGILQPNGSMRVVTIRGNSIVHSFDITQNGNHRLVFINNTLNTIRVMGNVSF